MCILQCRHCKLYSIALFVDHRKAFDCVNYDILLLKLHDYDIRGVSLDLLKNYFLVESNV